MCVCVRMSIYSYKANFDLVLTNSKDCLRVKIRFGLGLVI